MRNKSLTPQLPVRNPKRTQMLKNIWDFIFSNLGFRGIALLLICTGAVYIWYLHLRNRLLREQIDLDKNRKQDFLKRTFGDSPKQEITPKLQLSEKAKRVLIVDDEKRMLEVLEIFIKEINSAVEVDTAGDGKQALDKIRTKKPSILVTDIVMPGMSGIDLVNELKKQEIELPILIMSGYTDSVFVKHKGIEIGDHILFLPKPVLIKDFINALNQLVEKD